MAETLTYDQIKSRYDGEWVIVEDPQTNEQHEVLTGRVIAHSPDRDEAYRGLGEWARRGPHGRTFATLCFQEIPEGTTVIL